MRANYLLFLNREGDHLRYRVTWIWLTLGNEPDVPASLTNNAEFGNQTLPRRVSGQRRYRQRRFQYNVRYIDLRPMLRDGLQVELVASLSRLFFLRHFDPRDAWCDLQRVYILVSIIPDCVRSRM